MSPREIPGVPFGGLPDKQSLGKCTNKDCRRSYRSVKVLKEKGKKIKYLCPHCGEPVKIRKQP